MNPKPVARWNIGSVTHEGFAVLRIAVRNMQQLYGDVFEYVICYNNLSHQQRSMLPTVDRLIDQKEYINSLPYKPPTQKNPAWKLYPPRTSLHTHEIIMDNDLIFFDKPKLLDEFLSRTDLIVGAEATGRHYSDKWNHLVPEGVHINGGLIALPPDFDFGKLLWDFLELSPGEWDGRLDEQTLVAHTIHSHQIKTIPLSEINMCCQGNYQRGTCGVHFVGINNRITRSWQEYVASSQLLV